MAKNIKEQQSMDNMVSFLGGGFSASKTSIPEVVIRSEDVDHSGNESERGVEGPIDRSLLGIQRDISDDGRGFGGHASSVPSLDYFPSSGSDRLSTDEISEYADGMVGSVGTILGRETALKSEGQVNKNKDVSFGDLLPKDDPIVIFKGENVFDNSEDAGVAKRDFEKLGVQASNALDESGDSLFDIGLTSEDEARKGLLGSPLIDMSSCLGANDGSGRNYQDPALQGLKFDNSEIVFNYPSKGARNAWDIIEKAKSISLFKPGSSEEFNSGTLRHVLNGNTFCEMQGSEESWYVHPRILTTKGLDGKSRNIPLSKKMIDPKEQDVVSGVCLFGVSTLTAIAEDGSEYDLVDTGGKKADSPIIRIEENNSLHPYEMESVLRLTGFLDLLNTEKLNVSFYIPKLQYWQYGFQLYEKGLMSRDLLDQWFSMVDRRSKMVKDLIRKNLPSNANMPDFVEPLSGIEHILQEDMKEGERPVERIVEYLSSTDETWKRILDTSDTLALKEKKEAKEREGKKLPPIKQKFKLRSELDAVDLNHLSNVVCYAKKLDPNGDKLLLVVENPDQVMILHEGRNLMRTTYPTNILGLYPHPNIIVPKGKALRNRHNLFNYNYQENKLNYGNDKTVIYSRD